MTEHRKHLADQYLLLARDTTQSSAKFAIAVLAPLVLIWVVNLESLPERIDSVVSARSDYEQRNQIVEDTEGATNEEVRKKLDERKDEAKKEYDKLQKKLEEASQVELLGLKIPVPPHFLAPFWGVVLVLLMWHIANSRRRATSLIARAARIYRYELPVSAHMLGDRACGMPFWLAPLPLEKGTHLTAKEFRRAIGWDKTHLLHYRGVLVLLTVVLLIHLRVAWIGFELAAAEGKIARAEGSSYSQSVSRYKVPTTIRFYNVLLLGIDLGLILMWLRPRPVPDTYPRDRDPYRRDPYRCERRVFLKRSVSLALGVSVLAHGCWTIRNDLSMRSTVLRIPGLSLFSRRNPRFVSNKKSPLLTTTLRHGFYMNTRSNIAHYVNESRTGNVFVGVRQGERPNQLSQAQLQPISTQTLGSLGGDRRAHLSVSSISFELLATRLARDGHFDDACETFLTGIRHDLRYKRASNRIEKEFSRDKQDNRTSQQIRREPRADRLPRVSYRLYDLLAKLSVQSNKPQYLERATRLIKLENLSPLFVSRIQKWQQPEGKWWRKAVKRNI
ncbi:MAG: hypothetical protein CV088_17500 [Nitrospira sp. LK70]|nr:hypothetical protein [Nitrospira sp. LK70]